jgi:transcriptional regulator with XRE-family HTH domain
VAAYAVAPGFAHPPQPIGHGLRQDTFAGMLGVSVRTLQGWEQRRRKPTGPARALLLPIHHNLTAYFDAIAAWNVA